MNIIVTVEYSAEFYTDIPKPKATFALIFYIFQLSNKSNSVVPRKKKKIHFNPKHVTEADEGVELNPCLLTLHEQDG